MPRPFRGESRGERRDQTPTVVPNVSSRNPLNRFDETRVQVQLQTCEVLLHVFLA